MLFAAETLRWKVVVDGEAAAGFGRAVVLMLRRGLIIPSPGDRIAAGRGPSSTGDLLGIVAVFGNLIGAGVEGDSVPILDFLAPDLGVTLWLRGVVWPSVLPGDLDLTKDSLRAFNAGEEEAEAGPVELVLALTEEEPASLGVTIGLPARKLEERAGVSGFEALEVLVCLSEGMVGKGERVE